MRYISDLLYKHLIGTSAEVSERLFGTGSEMSGHFEPNSEVSFDRTLDRTHMSLTLDRHWVGSIEVSADRHFGTFSLVPKCLN